MSVQANLSESARPLIDVSIAPKDMGMEYTLTIVPQSQCSYIWAEVSELLRPAVERSGGRWTLEHLFDAIYNGHHTLWVGYRVKDDIKFTLTTQIVAYPNAQILAVQFLGGRDYNDWSDDMLTLLERYATDMGCNGIEAVARFGFWPLFKNHNYARAYVTYEKAFNGIAE